MQTKTPKTQKKLRGAVSLESVLVIVGIIAIAAIIVLALIGWGQSSASQLRAQATATVSGNIMSVEVTVLNGKLSGIRVLYAPSGQGSYQTVTGQCIVGGQTVSSTSLALVKGQSAVCYFTLGQLTAGTVYDYLLVGEDATLKKSIQIARGTFTAGVT